MTWFIPWLIAIASCGMNVQSADFTALWMQERSQAMTCDSRLVDAAQGHAEYLDSIHALSHTGEGESTPNQRVRAAGYDLLEWHGDGNTVESATSNSDDPAHALIALLGSPSHRVHLLGEGWFSEHTVYGVGNSGYVWVVIAAPQEEEAH